MKFILFTPDRRFPEMECDSVRLPVADSCNGKFSGSYGIRKGHADAIFSLSDGKISVSLEGKEIFAVCCSDGFASVRNDELRVTVSSADEICG